MKTLKSGEFVAVRNQAKVVLSSYKEKKRILSKLEELQHKLVQVQNEIDICDKFVYNKFGVHLDDVVQYTTVTIVNKEGVESKQGKWIPADTCVWNEETKLYEIAEPQVSAVVGEATEEFMNPVFDENGELVEG